MSILPRYAFLIGGPKCGTSTLANWLNVAPDICVAAGKEPRFFTDFGDKIWSGPGSDRFLASLARTKEDYTALFAHDADAIWRLDGSTDYLSCAASPGLIRSFAKSHEVKIIAILRDPVDRIVSEYQHTLRDGYQKNTLRESLALENERREQGFQPLFRHLERSRYSAQITAYSRYFGENLLVLDYHSAMKDSTAADQAAAFLGVSMPKVDAGKRSNVGHVPRNKLIDTIINMKTVRNTARKMVPKRLRNRVWHAIDAANSTRYSASEADLEYLRHLLADEIDACKAHPLINTSNWKTACPQY